MISLECLAVTIKSKGLKVPHVVVFVYVAGLVLASKYDGIELSKSMYRHHSVYPHPSSLARLDHV